MNLKAKLAEWTGKDLITESQGNKILDYEVKNAADNHWLYFGFLTVAALAIGAGIVSLIAYNWDVLTDGAKLAGGFLMLALFFASFAWCRIKNGTALAEVSLFLLFAGVLADIGLVAQVYNLVDLPHRGLLFWAVITTPLALLSTKPFLPFVWFTALHTGVSFEIMHNEAVIRFLAGMFASSRPLGVTLWSFAAALAWWMLIPKAFVKFPQAKRAVGFLLGLGVAVTAIYADFHILLFGLLRSSRMADSSVTGQICFFAIATAALALVWFLKPKEEEKFWTLAVAVLAIAIPLFYFADIGRISTAIVICLLFAAIATYYDLRNRKYACNFFILCMGARVIFTYFEASRSLLGTGVALIASGVIAIALLVVWRRIQPAVSKKVREIIK